MDILDKDYEQKRNIFEFCKWINDELQKLGGFSNSNEIYFERKGKNIKRLVEEAIPLASLGLYVFKPALSVHIELFPENHFCDAKLIIEGYFDIELNIEVTTLETDDSTMRRQSLSRHGFVFDGGKIKRKGEDIISKAAAVDVDIESEKLISLAYERGLKKIKRTNDRMTAILVSINNNKPMPFTYRKKLISQMQEYLYKEKPPIYGIYYCYGFEFLVDGTRCMN